MDITFDEGMEITDYNYTGNVLWNLIFEKVLAKKGLQWLLVIEPLVKTLAREYDLLIPEVFETNLKKAEEKTIKLNKENKMLKEINGKLASNLKEAEDKLIRCPITGLYNYDFFKNYFSNEITSVLLEDSGQNPGLIIIGMDDLGKIRYSYGDNEVEEVLKNTVYLFESIKEVNQVYFRLQDELFACYIPHTTKERAVIFAEKIRNLIASSEKFIE